MGQKDKEIKAIAVGLLTQRFMFDLLEDIRNANEKKKEDVVKWIQTNFRILLINKVNITMDLIDKRRLTADEIDSMTKATELAQVAYDAYLKGVVEREKRKEENKIMGENTSVVK